MLICPASPSAYIATFFKETFYIRKRFFQLRLFNEATVPGYELISGILLQCVLCYACICTVLSVWTPPPMFSETAVIARHFDATFFQIRA